MIFICLVPCDCVPCAINGPEPLAREDNLLHQTILFEPLIDVARSSSTLTLAPLERRIASAQRRYQRTAQTMTATVATHWCSQATNPARRIVATQPTITLCRGSSQGPAGWDAGCDIGVPHLCSRSRKGRTELLGQSLIG